MAISPKVAQARAKLATTKRHHRDRSDLVEAAERDLKAVTAEEYIKRLVDEAPPLSAAQRDRLALLLRGPRVAEGGADAA